MPRSTSKPTDAASDFDAAWKRHHAENYGEEIVPPGFITCYRYAKLVGGMTDQQASAFLRREVGMGRAEMKRFRVRSERGEMREQTHFRLVPKKGLEHAIPGGLRPKTPATRQKWRVT